MKTVLTSSLLKLGHHFFGEAKRSVENNVKRKTVWHKLKSEETVIQGIAIGLYCSNRIEE